MNMRTLLLSCEIGKTVRDYKQLHINKLDNLSTFTNRVRNQKPPQKEDSCSIEFHQAFKEELASTTQTHMKKSTGWGWRCGTAC